MTVSIDKYKLTPGQWVYFTHQNDMDSTWISKPYRIVNKDSEESCCRLIMNDEGSLGKFCPRLSYVIDAYLPFPYNVKLLTKENVQELLGDDKYDALESKAIQIIKTPKANL